MYGQHRFVSLYVDEPRGFTLNYCGQMKPDNAYHSGLASSLLLLIKFLFIDFNFYLI